MKKAFSALLVFILLLTACNNPTNSDLYKDADNQDFEEHISVSEGPHIDIPQVDEAITEQLDDTIREAIVKSGLNYVVNAVTGSSFNSLLDGTADIMFSTGLSEDQKTQAESVGVELEQYAISKDVFVFVLNSENPACSLTQQQLRDIYSGNITNWKELGGDDAEITAFQRAESTDSQHYMVAFMGDMSLSEPHLSLHLQGDILTPETIAIYDNGKYSIGYSYYAYAAGMYAPRKDLKFVAVDGIYPDEKSIGDDTYPLISKNYAVIRKDSYESTRSLIKWLLSDDGQQALGNNGHFSLDGHTAEIQYVLGTGPEKPSEDYIPDVWYHVDGSKLHFDGKISGMRDKYIESRINAQLSRFDNALPSMAFNGYLMVYVTVKSSDAIILFDLRTGRLIDEVSDLFWRDSDFLPYLRNCVASLEGVIPGQMEKYCDITVSDILKRGHPSSFASLCDLRYFTPARPDNMKDIWEDDVEITESYCTIHGNMCLRTDRGIICYYGPESGLGNEIIERLNSEIDSLIMNDESYKNIVTEFNDAYREHLEQFRSELGSYGLDDESYNNVLSELDKKYNEYFGGPTEGVPEMFQTVWMGPPSLLTITAEIPGRYMKSIFVVLD